MFKLIKACYQSVVDAVNHDGIEHAGYLSFLMMLSIFPSLFFFMSVIGVLGDKELIDVLIKFIMHSSFAGFIDALKPRILELASSPPQSFLTIAILSAIWTASSIFEALRTIFNKAYRVSSPPAYIFRRLISMLEFLTATFIIVSVGILLIALPYISNFLTSVIHSQIFENYILGFLSYIYSLFLPLFLFLSLAMLYYFIPNKKIRFSSVIPGACFTLIGWYIASITFKYYLLYFPQVNIIYGSIAGVIISLLYFYICSIVLIVGAELNYNFSKR